LTHRAGQAIVNRAPAPQTIARKEVAAIRKTLVSQKNKATGARFADGGLHINHRFQNQAALATSAVLCNNCDSDLIQRESPIYRRQ